MTAWIFGTFAAVVAVLGAILASHAIDIGMYTYGLGLIAFGIFFALFLMKDHFDQIELVRAKRRSH